MAAPIGEGIVAAVRCTLCGCIAGFCNHPGCVEGGRCSYGVVCRECEPVMQARMEKRKARRAA